MTAARLKLPLTNTLPTHQTHIYSLLHPQLEPLAHNIFLQVHLFVPRSSLDYPLDFDATPQVQPIWCKEGYTYLVVPHRRLLHQCRWTHRHCHHDFKMNGKKNSILNLKSHTRGVDNQQQKEKGRSPWRKIKEVENLDETLAIWKNPDQESVQTSFAYCTGDTGTLQGFPFVCGCMDLNFLQSSTLLTRAQLKFLQLFKARPWNKFLDLESLQVFNSIEQQHNFYP
ncbi:hypothetical protein M9H77_02200 [Catharanthus roseus]|uniref:Uncharacterized protein n=1 Tax=Catharanthus roseus TaxID=4058 RepID=A0ACC0C851_CATRO|nr:hypothetical protein M9H77_02200 [Catharanthus roseus]